MRGGGLKSIVFIVVTLIIFSYLVYSSFYEPAFIKDCIYGLVGIGVLYLFDRKFNMHPAFVIIGAIPFIAHTTGLMTHLYARYFFGIGFDKWLHFMATASGTAVIYHLLTIRSRRMIAVKLIMALLIMSGIGAINEVNEFVGARYFHVQGATLFSQGDELPPSLSDLQVYDTYWDMIFNVFGSLFSVVVISMTSLVLFLERSDTRAKVKRSVSYSLKRPKNERNID